MSKRVAIYGGAFNPPHHGHTATVSNILNSGKFESVILVPSGSRPDKSSQVSAQHRLTMVRMMIAHEFPDTAAVKVSDAQVQGKVGYATEELMRFFEAELFPSLLSFVVGSELLPDLPSWKSSEQLRGKVSFLVIPRLGYDRGRAPQGFKCEFLEGLEETSVSISSTKVRQLVRDRRLTAGFLSPPVVRYATEHSLYVP
jgi:nicotinate-nucleotide adenylyltransferase